MEALQLKQGPARWDEVSLGEVMLRLDPGEGRIHTTRISACGKAAANTTWRAACAAASACAPRIVTALADNPVGPARRRPDAAGRRRHFLAPLGSLRRRRAHRAQRPQLYRAWLRRARRRRLLRPRPHRDLPDATTRDWTGKRSSGRENGRALVPHRRHICGALGIDARRRGGCDGCGATSTARPFPTT